MDYLDGVAARMERKEGDDVVDIACDRVSEMLIFIPYPQVFWMLSLNILALSLQAQNKNGIPTATRDETVLFHFACVVWCAVKRRFVRVCFSQEDVILRSARKEFTIKLLPEVMKYRGEIGAYLREYFIASRREKEFREFVYG